MHRAVDHITALSPGEYQKVSVRQVQRHDGKGNANARSPSPLNAFMDLQRNGYRSLEMVRGWQKQTWELDSI